MLPVVPVIGVALLLAVNWIVRPVEVEQDAGGDAVVIPLAEVSLSHGLRQSGAGSGGHRVFQPGQRRQSGKVRAGEGQPATTPFQRRVMAQRGGVVPAGGLIAALGAQSPRKSTSSGGGASVSRSGGAADCDLGGAPRRQDGSKRLPSARDLPPLSFHE